MENSLANTTIIFMNYLLKELRNYQRKLFLRPQKNKRKRNQHFQLLFFTIDLHFVTSNQMCTYRKLNLPITCSIYLVFLPLEMQRTLKQTKVYYTFFYFV